MALKDVQLPELGEGVDSGDVVAVLVSPGDSVQKDQPLIEVECEKASVEIPCPFEGIVCEVKVKVGDQVKIGQTIITLETGKVQTEEETPSEADKENDDKTAVSDLDGERQPEPPSRTREAAGAPPQRTGDQGADGEGRREFSRARDRERTRGGSSPGR
ncbi:MAG: biotin/lipoyl-containing protein, partial [Thermodesulfobacteriota bacterium]